MRCEASLEIRAADRECCIFRDHACDIIAVFCFAMVAVKWVLRLMRSVASHVPKLRETATNMEVRIELRLAVFFDRFSC